MARKYIEIPSLGIDIAKPRMIGPKTWYQTHDFARSQTPRLRMLNLYELAEALKHLRSHDKKVFDQIAKLENPPRVVWLDDYFEKMPDGMHVFTGNKTKSENLGTCLMEDRVPGIDFNEWINNHTTQGLPKPNAKKGEMFYWSPQNKSVARLFVYSVWLLLYCYRYPTSTNVALGVFAVAENGEASPQKSKKEVEAYTSGQLKRIETALDELGFSGVKSGLLGKLK